ncbi:beta-lactamase-like protein [Coleophoma crateriformis]|uniref:Beta-lactamase-like protein n=1 Tax=Coleophoma crateriformis TaxID=565419 RepID=A0A3D8QY43_9HELO|nr:beta-lactamase-like protein [Coleophoma crateriformis]
MENFEQKLENAIRALEVPGAVACGGDAQGKSYYAKAFGFNSLKDDQKPMTVDSVFWIASCTKLWSSISALQCVERGLLTLDEDVTRLLPELKDIEVLKGFEQDSGKPILVKAKKTITLRHLLTHTSGLAYDAFNPELMQWRTTRGEGFGICMGTVLWRCLTPLVHEPGESYAYSTGFDWAGVMVARATKMTLEEHIQKYICEPLGIKDISFHLEKRPDMLSRLCEMSERQGGITMFGTPVDVNGAIQWTVNNLWKATGLEDDAGGAGGYATAIDYQKITQSLANNDEKLLSSSMLDQMCTPQLGPEAQATAEMLLKFPEYHNIAAPGVPMDTKFGVGLGGLIVLEDLPSGRKKGSISWGGLPNLMWWVDRASGVSGFYGSQLVPTADPKTIEMGTEFERALYAKVNAGI